MKFIKKIRNLYRKLFWSQERFVREFSEHTDRMLFYGDNINIHSYPHYVPSFENDNDEHQPVNPVLTRGFIEGGIVSADFRHNLDHLGINGIRTEEQNLLEQNLECEDDFIDAVREGINNLRNAGFRPNSVVNYGSLVEMESMSKLNKRFPHKCFNCKKSLYFQEILDANRDIDRSHLEKLWRSKYVQFYCCECYRYKDILVQNYR